MDSREEIIIDSSPSSGTAEKRKMKKKKKDKDKETQDKRETKKDHHKKKKHKLKKKDSKNKKTKQQHDGSDNDDDNDDAIQNDTIIVEKMKKRKRQRGTETTDKSQSVGNEEEDDQNAKNEKKKFVENKEDDKQKSKRRKKQKHKLMNEQQQEQEHDHQNIIMNPSSCSGSNNTNHNDNAQCSHSLPPHQYILAPMVGASELAFRLLCRNYGTQLTYTPMMSSKDFASDKDDEFQTCLEDKGLVVHLWANQPQEFANAVKRASQIPHCVAVDLNLGCPQRTAYLGHFGSYLLDQTDLIYDIIKAGVDATTTPNSSTDHNGTNGQQQQYRRLPIFCKIRLLDTIEETIQLCLRIRDAGASLIAIHARYRATWDRKGAGARDGPALLEQVTQIRQAVSGIQIISNGNVITYDDVEINLRLTNAHGIMSAEGILDNPALFLPRLCETKGQGQEENANNDKEQIMVNIVQPIKQAQKHSSSSSAESKTETAMNTLTSSQNEALSSTDNEPTITKRRRKLLKKLRSIEHIEQKQSNGQSLEKEEYNKLAQKEDLLNKLKQLSSSCSSNHVNETNDNSNTKRDSPSLSANGSTDSTSNGDDVLLETRTIPLNELCERSKNKLHLAREYMALVECYPVKIRSVIFHIRRMLKNSLMKYQLMEDCISCTTIKQIYSILDQIELYQTSPEKFVFDREKAQQEKDALERKRREEGKRKAFEARMIRKAKREHKPLDFYLHVGAAVPTVHEINHLQTLSRDEALTAWKEKHSQHCLNYHLDESKGCQRGRSCAFLHVDAQQGDGTNNTTFVETDEVAG